MDALYGEISNQSDDDQTAERHRQGQEQRQIEERFGIEARGELILPGDWRRRFGLARD